MTEFEMHQALLEAGYPDTPGIYAIEVANKIVYVGQSKRLAARLAEHQRRILRPRQDEEYKYQLLHDIHDPYKCGERISFKILENCEQEQLDEKEAYWILHYEPVLNSVIPGRRRRKLREEYSMQQFIQDLGI